MKATFAVEVAGTVMSSVTQTLTAEAMDRIEVTVPPAAGSTPGESVVEVHPGGSGQVQLVLLTASAYPAASDGSPQLTYDIDSSGTPIDLDAPLLVVGSGAVAGLLGGVGEITLANASSGDVVVQILVGRDATT